MNCNWLRPQGFVSGLAGLLLVVAVVGGAPANALPIHRWSFDDGTANDSVGGAHGTLEGGATISGGQLVLAGSGQHAELPGPTIAINTFSELTLEIWLTSSPTNIGFTMAAVLGRTFNEGLGEPDWAGYQYVMIQPTREDADVSRVAITREHFELESGVNGPERINDDVEHYLAVTVDATDISYYFDGSLVGSSPLGDNSLAALSNELAYLGRSVYQFDPYFVGSINEFRIYDSALSGAEIARNSQLGPNVVIPEPSAVALAAAGLIVAAGWRRRK